MSQLNLEQHTMIYMSVYLNIKLITSSVTMSLNLTSCERETEAVRWYSTSSLRELNFTTHKKNLPCASRNTLKCCTPSEHLKKRSSLQNFRIEYQDFDWN